MLFLAATLVACYLSKNTAFFVFALAPITLLLAALRGRFTLLLYVGAALILVGVTAVSFKWGAPAAWYAGPTGQVPARKQIKDAPLGNYVFEFDDSTPGKAASVLQVMPVDQPKLLRGKTITLGSWIWADQPTQANPLFVKFYRQGGGLVESLHDPVQVTVKPTFYTVTFSVPDDAVRGLVYVSQVGHGLLHNNIYFDGLVLLPGAFGGTAPTFIGPNGLHVRWNGQQYDNLLRNPSAEEGSFQIRRFPGDTRIIAFMNSAGISPYLMVTTLQDWAGTGWYYQGMTSTLFRTFWASLAGDKAFLRSTWVSTLLQVWTVLGVMGVPVALWMARRRVRWDLVGFLGLAVLIPWLLAAARGTTSFPMRTLLYPWARYAYPGILPTALLLCTGWWTWMQLLSGPLKWDQATRNAIFLGGLLGLSAFAFLNAIQVLHQSWWDGWTSLILLFLFQYVVFRWVIRWPARGMEQPPSGGAGTA